MKASVEKTIKFAIGTCAALGVVAIGAVVASGAAVKVVAESLKGAKAEMEKTIKELREEKNDEVIVSEIGLEQPSEVEITPADFAEEASETAECQTY